MYMTQYRRGVTLRRAPWQTAPVTVKGVLFDFSGTLFHIESPESWLGAAAARCGITLGEDELHRLAVELADTGAQPGGGLPREVPTHLAEVWAQRDRSAAEHRAAYLGLAREVALPAPELHEALYARHMEPAAWHPYPDAAAVLTALHGCGVRTAAVVSNIGWDLRPVFRARTGWTRSWTRMCCRTSTAYRSRMRGCSRRRAGDRDSARRCADGRGQPGGGRWCGAAGVRRAPGGSVAGAGSGGRGWCRCWPWQVRWSRDPRRDSACAHPSPGLRRAHPSAPSTAPSPDRSTPSGAPLVHAGNESTHYAGDRMEGRRP
ncbi:hypothetical protein GCM10020221_20100 [Streptomyces thioluteus]|uniref:Hydrolase n=1 Tax=Streptomyces thioluteus TaxID=66431 RepID=A0ABN3WPX3_STRTU